MEVKKKKCKGTGKAAGFESCGGLKYIHRYGLCSDCFKDWLFSTPEGKKEIDSSVIRAKKKAAKEAKQKFRKVKEENRKKSYYEKLLQDEINEIVRLIDTEKGCISCEHGWFGKVTRQFHAGHRKSVGSNPALRFHLFNIFKQCSICNNYKSGNERAYDSGILKHYGKLVLDAIQTLSARYGALNLTKEDLRDKIRIARKIKKEILNGKDFTREEINREIGIYKCHELNYESH